MSAVLKLCIWGGLRLSAKRRSIKKFHQTKWSHASGHCKLLQEAKSLDVESLYPVHKFFRLDRWGQETSLLNVSRIWPSRPFLLQRGKRKFRVILVCISTGCPLISCGLNRHCFTAVMAASANSG